MVNGFGILEVGKFGIMHVGGGGRNRGVVPEGGVFLWLLQILLFQRIGEEKVQKNRPRAKNKHLLIHVFRVLAEDGMFVIQEFHILRRAQSY